MEEKETLVIYVEELKEILAEHYIGEDYKTNSYNFKTEDLKNKEGIQFILNCKKKIEPFKTQIEKEIIITKDEVIEILNDRLFNEGYEIATFTYNQRTQLERLEGICSRENTLNFITLRLRKKAQKTMKKMRWKKNV